jgi:GTPase
LNVHGHVAGIRKSDLKALEDLYTRRVPFDVLTTHDLARALAKFSHQTGRQSGVLVDRSGKVHFVVVGDATKLMLPDVGRMRAAEGRLRGLRLIHTHLYDEPLTRDDIVDLTRLRLDLVVAICLAPGEDRLLSVYYGHNVPVPEGSSQSPVRTYGPIPYSQIAEDPAALVEGLEQEFARLRRSRRKAAAEGRVMLVQVLSRAEAPHADERLRELEELSRTAGLEVAGKVRQIRDRVDPKTVLGKGKLDEVVIECMNLDVDVLVFDRDLTATQASGIARQTDLKILDRTQLILDIFAQRAESRDGKLQVELAQMKYLLPRLGQKDDSLSRLTGGIGGRGPGETKLEIGRRRARERVTRLERELEVLARQREQRRASRTRSDVPVVSVIGYTNAGKSTLLNTMTHADVLAEDKLFATLDTRSRRYRLPSGHTIVLSDTVGFIRDLPKELFAAFRATFEEAADADLLLQVVDASDPSYEIHLETTDKLVESLSLGHVPRLLVLNKCDLVPSSRAAQLAFEHDAVTISALDRASLSRLDERIERALRESGRIT